MVVLHISPLSGDKSHGVHAVVPLHVAAQRGFADAALWNLGEKQELGDLPQFQANSLGDLPSPYDRPDIAVFHEVYIPRYPAVAKELKAKGIPYIIIPHGCLKKTAQRKSRLKKIIGNLLIFRRFCSGAAAIQCLTESEMRESVMGKRFFVAPNGIEPPEKRKSGFRKTGLRFVYVGRLLPEIKGLDLMIAAFGREKAFLKENGCRLDLYGPAEDRGISYLPQLREYISRNGVQELVCIHPAVYGEEKRSVLLDADIFIQTSRTEAMPMGILEALSYGLPCLVSEGTGFAVTTAAKGAGWNGGMTAESIAEALKNAVSDAARLPEISRSAEAYSREFGWENAAKTAVEEYRSLIGR